MYFVHYAHIYNQIVVNFFHVNVVIMFFFLKRNFWMRKQMILSDSLVEFFMFSNIDVILNFAVFVQNFT